MPSKQFPRTEIGGLSVSRMIMGTNNILGGSHRTKARDMHILEIFKSAQDVAKVIEAYLEYGIDTIIGCLHGAPHVRDAMKMAEDRTGRKVHYIELGVFDTADNPQSRADAETFIKQCAAFGCDIFLPLHTCVERMVNKQTQTIDRITDYLAMIRDCGMIPGLSAHMPEVIEYTDANGYDVETYIQIYNASGFLMQIEVETVNRIIWKAKKPVLTIKPLAAGHLNPFVGLNFAWNTIRDKDMVAIGCMSAREVHEVVEISFAAFERRMPDVDGRLHQY